MDCKSTFCPFKLKENNNIGRKHSILIRFVIYWFEGYVAYTFQESQHLCIKIYDHVLTIDWLYTNARLI